MWNIVKKIENVKKSGKIENSLTYWNLYKKENKKKSSEEKLLQK